MAGSCHLAHPFRNGRSDFCVGQSIVGTYVRFDGLPRGKRERRYIFFGQKPRPHYVSSPTSATTRLPVSFFRQSYCVLVAQSSKLRYKFMVMLKNRQVASGNRIFSLCSNGCRCAQPSVAPKSFFLVDGTLVHNAYAAIGI